MLFSARQCVKRLFSLSFPAERGHTSNMLSTPNAASLDHMSATERLDEIAELLAAGLLRARSAKSTALSADRGERFVDLSARESGHAPVPTETETAR
jgi:hypothetical protein